jgi:acetyltransferase-like isoleucine patch superfamily enzyme
MIKIIFQILIMPLPWFIRRRILCSFFNYEIAKSAFIGKSIILAESLIMKEHSVIGSLTFCKNIGLLSLDEYARIGSLNYITGFPQNNNSFFSHRIDRKCELIVKKHSAITSRHFLDCTCGIYLGEFTTFAGLRSQILSHSIDITKNLQDCKPVHIGSYCFIGTNVVILPGSILPDYSILGAKSLLNKEMHIKFRLYGGVPAKELSTLVKEKTKYFNRVKGFVG